MRSFSALSLPFLFVTLTAGAALDSSQVHSVDGKKSNSYLRTGVYVGGSSDVKDVLVEDIRRATNAGFERVVIDLSNALDSASTKTPYYQVAVEPELKRVVVSVHGRPRAAFDAKKVRAAFAKSVVVSRVELLPSVDPAVWVVTFYLHDAPSLEVFELSSPLRLILDFKLAPGAATSPVSPPPSPKKKKKSAASARKVRPSPPKIAEPASDDETSAPSHDSLPIEKGNPDPVPVEDGVPESADN